MRPGIRIVELGGSSPFDSYRAAVRLVTDWQTLAALSEQIEYDDRLTVEQRDELYVLVNSRELAIRPSIRGATT